MAEISRRREQGVGIPDNGAGTGFGVEQLQSMTRFAIDDGGGGPGGRRGGCGQHKDVGQFRRRQARADRGLARRILWWRGRRSATLCQQDDNGAGGNDGAAATDGDDEVGIGFPGGLDASQNVRRRRSGSHAVEDAGRFLAQCVCDALKEIGALRNGSATNDEWPFCSDTVNLGAETRTNALSPACTRTGYATYAKRG